MANDSSSTDLLRQSPFGPLLDIPGVTPEKIFGNLGGSNSGNNADFSSLPYGGNPFAGDNFWKIFNNGVNPADPKSTGPSNGSNPFGGSLDGSGSLGNSTTTTPSVNTANTTQATDSVTGAPSNLNLGGAFGGATNETEIRAYIDKVVNDSIAQGGGSKPFDGSSNPFDGGTQATDPFAPGGSNPFGIPFDGIDPSQYGIPTQEALTQQGISNVKDSLAQLGSGDPSQSFDLSKIFPDNSYAGQNPFANGNNPFANGQPFSGGIFGA